MHSTRSIGGEISWSLTVEHAHWCVWQHFLYWLVMPGIDYASTCARGTGPNYRLQGQPLTVVMPERYREMHVRGLTRLLATGVTTLIGRTVQVEALRRNGEEVQVELALAQLRDPSEAPQFAAVIRDLRQVRRLEEAVHEARL